MERFINLISKERATAYKLNNDETNKDVLNRYLFNVALGKSFYPLLDMFEICLRNKINNVFISDFGVDWITSDKFLDERIKPKVDEVIQRVKAENKEITNNRLVSELNLGFWNSLFNNSLNVLWQQNSRVFRVFGAIKTDIRKINRDLTVIRKFRNRVFHFETLFTHRPKFCYELLIKYLKAVVDNEDFIKILDQIDEVKGLVYLPYDDLKQLDLIVNSVVLTFGGNE